MNSLPMKMNYPNFVTKMMKNYHYFVTNHHLQEVVQMPLVVEVPMPPEVVEVVHL
jgi:hypothetical protein